MTGPFSPTARDGVQDCVAGGEEGPAHQTGGDED
jgi:hypothetical protein